MVSRAGSGEDWHAGNEPPAIAHQLGCDDQTVRNVIHEFNAMGLSVLQEGSSRPHRLHTSFSEDGLVRLKDLLHRSPRDFGKERGRWTLELAAQVSFEQGIIATHISDESVRRALKRLKTNWKRATVPAKKRARPLDCLGQPAAELGDWLWR